MRSLWLNFQKVLIKERSFLLMFVMSTFVFSLWLAAFFPGVMTPDSLTQWDEASTLQLNNLHPYLHTLLIVFLKGIYNSPATIALFQILLTSITFSYIFSFFLKKGVSKWLIFPLFCLFTFSIPVGIYSITLWKDIPFSVCLVLLGFVIAKQYWAKRLDNSHLILIFVLSIVTTFFRHNGVINILLLPISFLLCFYRVNRLKTVILISSFLMVTIFLRMVLPSVLQVKPIPDFFAKGAIYFESVGLLRSYPESTGRLRVTTKTIALLEKLAPIQDLVSLYDPRGWDSLWFSKKVDQKEFYNPQFWDDLSHEFFYYNLPNNFNFFLGNRVTMFITSTLAYGPTAATDIFPNEFGLITTSLSNPLQRFFSVVINAAASNHFVSFLIWNSLLAFIVLVVFLIDSFYRKNYTIMFFCSFLLIHGFSLAAVSIAGDWRYYYFIYLSIFVAIPLYVLSKRSVKL